MLKNGFYAGSFNPLHNGHIYGAILPALEHFETFHIFVRYNEGVDLTDWETKAEWFERVNEQCGGRLVIHKVEPSFHDKNYEKLAKVNVLEHMEKIAGVHFDGAVAGDDYQGRDKEKQKAFDGFLRLTPERFGGYSSSEIRKDPEGKKDWMPDYVYASLHARK